MGTSTTALRTAGHDGILNAALLALAGHAAEHALPAPFSIDLPTRGEPLRPPLVRFAFVDAQEAWLATVDVDGHRIEPGTIPAYVSHEWDVRLPDTGTCITLRGTRRIVEAVA